MHATHSTYMRVTFATSHAMRASNALEHRISRASQPLDAKNANAINLDKQLQ